MKRFLLLSLVLGLWILPLHATAASQVKLKYVGSIYTDATGVALNKPAGVFIGKNSLLVADSGGKRLLTFNYSDSSVKPDKIIPLPDMFPLMAQQADNGDIYLLDGRSRQIYLLGTAGNIKGKLSAKGVPRNTKIVPRSIKLTAEGSLLILDIFSERVLVLDPAGTFQRQISFPAEYGSFSDVVSDKAGTIYLLDSVGATVYSAETTDETFTSLTPSLKQHMNFPTSLATDNTGHLYLLDKYGSGLAVLGTDGRFIGRKLGMGWKDGQLYYPSQISIDSSQNLFIADTENNRIQQFSISE